MTRRKVIGVVVEGKRPPCGPWEIGLTKGAPEKIQHRFGQPDKEDTLQNHFLRLGSDIGFFSPDPLDLRFLADIPERIVAFPRTMRRTPS